MPDGSFKGIDLNGAEEQRPDLPLHDLDDLKRRLADGAAEIYPRLFRHSRITADRRELRMANVHGDAPHGEGSCVVELDGEYAGCIRDWNTDEHGDQLDTIRYATGLEGRALFEYAANLVGATPTKPNGRVNGHTNGHDKKNNWQHEIAYIKQGCIPITGTLGETYLKNRGLDLPDCSDLLFHELLTDYGAKRGRPGIVAVIRDPMTGTETGGIHRTFLADDGSGKAPIEKPKKMLGPSIGVVMLVPMRQDGTLGIGEGIETSLAGGKLFNVPAWAALSAGNLRRFQFPPGLKRLFIFADRGKDGEAAANELYRRAVEAKIEAIIVWPKSDDDFAEDLKQGYRAADYEDAPSEPPLDPDEVQATTPEPEIIPPPRTEAELIEAAQKVNRGDTAEIGQILRGCVNLDALSQQRVLDVVKSQTGLGLTVLKAQIKSFRQEAGKLSRSAGPRGAWIDKLKLKDNFEPQPNLFNVAIALRHDEAWRGVIGRNEFTGRIQLLQPPPWHCGAWMGQRDWTDDDDLKATEWVQNAEICAPKQVVADAVESVANENPFHPVRDWLNDLQWDGTSRLDHWLQTYCGVEDTAYSRAVAARYLISAVARVFQPGCKADCALILEGDQGIGKSTMLRVLFDPWFTDEIADLGSKDSAMQLAGVWCIEMAELDALRGAEVSRIKAFLSRTNDRYRPPYGKRVIDVARQCVFAGSVNEAEYLRDATGGRRFWPVRCSKADWAGVHAVREQLWAEAVVRYRGRERWHLYEKELVDEAAEEQAARQSRHPWTEPIGSWLNLKGNEKLVWEGVTTGQVLRDGLMKNQDTWTEGDATAVGRCLRQLGWLPQQVRIGKERERRYKPRKPNAKP
jgi:putative DNA primase/helicase